MELGEMEKLSEVRGTWNSTSWRSGPTRYDLPQSCDSVQKIRRVQSSEETEQRANVRVGRIGWLVISKHRLGFVFVVPLSCSHCRNRVRLSSLHAPAAPGAAGRLVGSLAGCGVRRQTGVGAAPRRASHCARACDHRDVMTPDWGSSHGTG